MIINIRGTSGSGKSTLVKQLMLAHGGMQPWIGPDPTRNKTLEVTLGYYSADKRIGVPGRYETACGGCDTIKTQDETQRRVLELASLYDNVVFEGLLISHIYGRWGEMASLCDKKAMHHDWVFAFLDTPLEVCLERVKFRRELRGNTKELDPTNTIQKWHDSRRVAEKANADGHKVVWLPYEKAQTALEALLVK